MKRIIFIFVAALAFSFSCSGGGEEGDVQKFLEKDDALSRLFSNNLFLSVQELKQQVGFGTNQIEIILEKIPEGYLKGLVHVLNQSSNIAIALEKIDIPNIVALASRTGHDGLGLGYSLMRIADKFMESIGLRNLVEKYFDDLYPKMKMADQLLVSIEAKTERKIGGFFGRNRHDIKFVSSEKEIKGWRNWLVKKKSLIGTAGSLAFHIPDVPNLKKNVELLIGDWEKKVKPALKALKPEVEKLTESLGSIQDGIFVYLEGLRQRILGREHKLNGYLDELHKNIEKLERTLQIEKPALKGEVGRSSIALSSGRFLESSDFVAHRKRLEALKALKHQGELVKKFLKDKIGQYDKFFSRTFFEKLTSLKEEKQKKEDEGFAVILSEEEKVGHKEMSFANAYERASLLLTTISSFVQSIDLGGFINVSSMDNLRELAEFDEFKEVVDLDNLDGLFQVKHVESIFSELDFFVEQIGVVLDKVKPVRDSLLVLIKDVVDFFQKELVPILTTISRSEDFSQNINQTIITLDGIIEQNKKLIEAIEIRYKKFKAAYEKSVANFKSFYLQNIGRFKTFDEFRKYWERHFYETYTAAGSEQKFEREKEETKKIISQEIPKRRRIPLPKNKELEEMSNVELKRELDRAKERQEELEQEVSKEVEGSKKEQLLKEVEKKLKEVREQLQRAEEKGWFQKLKERISEVISKAPTYRDKLMERLKGILSRRRAREAR